jgi:hypothetical protein
MGKKLKALPQRSEAKQECLFSLLLFNTIIEFFVREIREEKEIKRHKIRKEEVKVSLLEDDMLL